MNDSRRTDSFEISEFHTFDIYESFWSARSDIHVIRLRKQTLGNRRKSHRW